VDTIQPAPQSRPSNRKATIVFAAAQLFHERGYARVSVDDIASVVGISAPAVYRHFQNKQELLLVAVVQMLELYESAVRSHSGADELAAALASTTVENPHLGSLLARELENLAPHSLAVINTRCAVATDRIATDIRATRPEVTVRESRVLADAIFAIVTSNSFNQSTDPRTARAVPLGRTIRVVYSSDAIIEAGLAASGKMDDIESWQQPWLSRSEAILAAGPRVLLNRGGYDATTLDDLGAAVGISGSSIYNHFGSKAEVFHAVAQRTIAWSITDLQRALAASRSGEDALVRALRSHIALARSASAVTVSLESLVLTPEQEKETLDGLAAFTELWVTCIRAARPGISPLEANVVVIAILAIATGLGQLDRHVGDTPPSEALVEIAVEIARGL
jgi:AcrR family transcriptional regulator